MGLTRRLFLKAGATAGAVGVVSASRFASARRGSGKGGGSTNQSVDAPFRFTPFTQELETPGVLQPFPLDPEPGRYPGPRFGNQPGGPASPRGDFNDVAHGIAPEFDGRVPGFPCPDWNKFSNATHEVEYKHITEETTQQFFPGVDTPVFTYRDANQPPGSGRTPGPTVIADYRKPIVVRNENHLTADRHPVNTTGYDVETSIHLHGTHAPAHADGYPDFYVLAGEARDYFYPNTAPRVSQFNGQAKGCEGDFDATWIPSTLWYHDHAMDITGFNVSRGLAGFYLVFDDRQKQLIADRILPNSFGFDDFGNPLDIGLALTDRAFNADGTLAYDFLDHNGHLGDVFTVNGTVQPFLRVQRRKYRFRMLNASNARVYQLRLSTRQPFLVIGADSWLFPRAGLVNSFELASAQRHDVIIDFRHAPDEVFLENIMIQEDGRKGKEVDPRRPTPLLKFVVDKGSPIPDDVTVTDDTPIRGVAGIDPSGQWAPIRADEIVATREFRFERANGGWTVNNRFFNPRRADALPRLGAAERWIIRNNSGGWWHPFHLHLEGFQIQTVNGRQAPFERSFNADTVNVHGDEVIEIFAKFRTFTGPFVFHCHVIEHEDMRMMAVHDPRPAGQVSPLDGETRIDSEVSGVVPDCPELEAEERIFFNAAGDVERLKDRGVGFPDCEFDLNRRGNRSRG